MKSTLIENFEKLLNGPRDGVMLRYSLGNEYLKLGDGLQAARYFEDAVTMDPRYSAAWKMLGKAREAAGQWGEALGAFEKGVAVAEEKGDVQAAKEMRVFARRLQKRLSPTAAGEESPPAG